MSLQVYFLVRLDELRQSVLANEFVDFCRVKDGLFVTFSYLSLHRSQELGINWINSKRCENISQSIESIALVGDFTSDD